MTISADAEGGRRSAGRGLLGPSLTPREAELLTVTLQVLDETGYDKLTVDQVVARAHASKTTVYRRWPSKAELVSRRSHTASRGSSACLPTPAPCAATCSPSPG